jgi:hypothetical protein
MAMADNKMTGKQKVVKGFDLNAFVGASEPEEVQVVEPLKSASKPADAAKLTKPSVEAKKVTMVPKITSQVPKENLTERVQIRLTKSEMDKLAAQCGLVPSSAFLRNFMKENGLI